ncbi:hypothetical protein GRI89_01005 [Altererythrobacter salegens]|uniref:Uncharacterized protein n=1 Tax=Croceibacterium salegens TaxID=1737568 RepID=A0A6I4SQP3_9SPHN|nr:hypothetical protein [Croceibacterium salegens]MXO58125.1 hypothetical protein [Croceibacterium salegens]
MSGPATRGQPLLVFAAILGSWPIGRVMLWESPFPVVVNVPQRLFAETAAGVIGEGVVAMAATTAVAGPGLAPPTLLGFAGAEPAPGRGSSNADFAPVRVRTASGHNVLLAAAFARLTLPTSANVFYASSGAALAAAPSADRPLLGSVPARVATSRWSADGWLLWRDGSGTAVAPGAASYGRSQAGAVLRYRLAAAGMRPEAYARVTRTVEGPRQVEFAAGVSARPIAAVPLRFAAEARVTDTAAGREVRPAAFAVTELPAQDLPHGLRAEGYAQAGWVGGDFATVFVDGQARVDGRVARLGTEGEDLRAGVGAWGGAQEGAARLDLGPSAAVSLKVGDVRSRLAVDYRIRVAGDAAPSSGPALTFSAGF